jgi:nitroimidazol reductase NimA-like FMN-containing flavoprotein (pyridoxamine 5'-phosphate oxidase superfamily)
VSFLSTAVQQVLEQGTFCAVATVTARGPHCTPLVFAYSGGRIWLTTSRGSVKARAWREDPTTAGLVRLGDMSVTFTGTVKLYDALDRRTWGDAVAGATSIARATATFSRKNARFFAGYAVDARQVPFAWTPPGRVFVGVDIERTALLDDEGVQEGRGRWAGDAGSHGSFRRTTKGDDPLAPIPRGIRDELGQSGTGSLTVVGERGPVVLPVRWLAEQHALYAALPADTLALADAGPAPDVALTLDAISEWRARDMAGAMLRGTGACYVADRVGSGAKTMRALAAAIDRAADALVRVEPRRAVWWQGWTSGSAELG